ncbi:MAG: UDP-N-acetylmuramoyl-tripeptide--D-alanyl-D-alanine ligase [Planctomycetes bacterium]|nr:UDP-N-acetylmuramoyl-tripeptide--D-alanyl-D-alanine ligase [Planctomycetota bacterium]
MIPLSLQEIINATDGKIIRPHRVADAIIKGISTDTRTLKPGSLFVALQGPNFNGHRFIPEAIRKGARAVLVSRPVKCRRPAIVVPDTLKALGDLARYYRNILSAKVIAVTGSNGKTTTKDMIAHIIFRKYQTVKSPKSFNNFIGVPLTIFSADQRHKCLVIEAGTNKPGEIAYLADIIKPDIAVVTNVSATHLERLKSVAGVAQEKSALFDALTPNGAAIYDIGNALIKRYISKGKYRIVTFGMYKRADIRVSGISIKPSETIFTVQNGSTICRCRLNVVGSYNIYNALAAIAAARAFGIGIKESCAALGSFRLPEMRMQKCVVNGITYINDAYNANPASVTMALRDFAALTAKGRKVFVFGEMRELGRHSRRFHRQIADEIIKAHIDGLIGVGKETYWTVQTCLRRGSRLRPDGRLGGQVGRQGLAGLCCKHKMPIIKYYQDVTPVRDYLDRMLVSGDSVLIKGSRAIGLEKILPSPCLTELTCLPNR